MRALTTGQVLVGLWILLFSVLINADPYPPQWQSGQGSAIHFQPVNWPSEPSEPKDCGTSCGQWQPYTRFQNNLADPRTKDESNGGTSPQSYVNVASSCQDRTLPSIYYYLHKGASETDDVIMFRWRVESPAHTYATGKNAGNFGASNPWSSALWTVFFDLGGNGYRTLAAHLDGSVGRPGEEIDRIAGIWSNRDSNSLDYEADPNIHLLGHNPTAFIGDNNKILNFNNNLSPSENWPNGANETKWDYGTSRATLVSNNSCNEYFIDYQIPVAMLDATAKGGPKITRDTPLSMLFCTANSLNNPLQKDCALKDVWSADPTVPAPFGDYLSFNQTEPYSQPIVSSVVANAPQSCSDNFDLQTVVQDTLAVQNGKVVTSMKSVAFYYWYDKDGDGKASSADIGSKWTKAGNDASLQSGSLNTWQAEWNASALAKGKYLIGVQALDDNTIVDTGMTTSGIDNRTFSYLSGDSKNIIYKSGSWAAGEEANFPEHAVTTSPSSSENWYGNPSVTGQQVALVGTAINACGVAPSITLSANKNKVVAGELVEFTISVSNPSTNSDVITLANISHELPTGFSYKATSSSGVSAAEPVITGQTLSWDVAAQTIVAGGQLSQVFQATAATTAGQYNNTASAVTSFSQLRSQPVLIAVDAARVSAFITPDSYSVAADATDTITFTVDYTNDALIDVQNGVIKTTLPTGVNYISCAGGVSCSISGQEINWDIGALNAGVQGSVTYTVSVGSNWSSSSLTTSATVSVTAPDNSVITKTPSTTVAVTGLANSGTPAMGLNITANVVQVAPGGAITYTLTYSNDGDADAVNVVLKNTLPAGFSFTSCDSACANSNDAQTWQIGTVAKGASGSVSVTATAADPFDSFTNPAIDKATLDFTDGTQVTAQLVTGVTGNMCNNYYFSADTVNVGAAGVKQTANTQVISSANSGSSTTVTAPANSFIEALRLYQDPASLNTIPFSGDLTTTVYIDRKNGPSLSIRSSVYDYDSITGNQVLLGQSVQSFGGNTKGELTTTVNLSGSLDKDHRLLWIYEAQSDHNKTAFDVQFQYGGTVTNAISGGSTAAISKAYFCVTPPANLTLKNTVSDISVNAGDTPTLTYQLDYANTGEITANNAQLTASLPTGFSACQYSSDNASWLSCSASTSHTFNLGSIAAGNNGVVYLKGVVPAGTSGGQTLTSTATIISDETSQLSAQAKTQVIAGSAASSPAELRVSLKANKTSLTPGDEVIYTATVSNVGGQDASAVQLLNDLPISSYFQYKSCSESCTNNSNTLTWNIGTLAAGASKTVTYTMQTSTTGLAAGITQIVDDANASGSALSSVTSNEVLVNITGNPRLSISNTASKDTGLAPSESLTYTLTVSNLGSVSAENTQIVVPFPNKLLYANTAMTPQGSVRFDQLNNQIVFELAELTAAQTVTLTFKASIAESLPSGTTNLTTSATVYSSNAASASADEVISAIATPVLDITHVLSGTSAYPAAVLNKAVSSSTTLYVDRTDQFSIGQLIKVGSDVVKITNVSSNALTIDNAITASNGESVISALTLSINYQNIGNATASNVVVTETLPAQLTYYLASPSANSAPAQGSSGVLSWNIGSLASGRSGNLQIKVFPTGEKGAFDSTAEITASNASSDSAVVSAKIGGLLLDKATSTAFVSAGSEASYSITLTNTLTTDITGVIVRDVLSDGFSYQANSGSVDSVSQEPSFDSADALYVQPYWENLSIPANSSITIRFKADISADIGAGKYHNDLAISGLGNVGFQSIDPTNNSKADVTVLADNTGLLKAYVFNRTSGDSNSYVQGTDIPLSNVKVKVHKAGDDCSNLYSATCYIRYTNTDGYVQLVAAAETWQVTVDDSTGDINTAWTQTVGNNGDNVTIISGSETVDHNGYGLIDKYTVSATAGSGGNISPSSQTVNAGTTAQLTVTPNSGYEIQSVTGCSGALSGNLYTTGAINADCSVSASFSLKVHTVTATAGSGGSISPSTQTVTEGNTAQLTVTPDTGYKIDSVSGCSGTLLNNTYTTSAISADCAVTASFSLINLETTPVAKADVYPLNSEQTLLEGGTYNAAVSVLNNDSDADGDTLKANLQTSPANGTLTFNENGTFTYIHNGGESTSDSFTYSASDGKSDSNIVTVSINITAVNDKPVAKNDSYSLKEGETLNGSTVLTNDTDAEGDTLTAVIATNPSNGTLTLNSNGTFTYVHDGGESTSDSFTYFANDGKGNSTSVATVTLTISGTNDLPVAVNDSYTVGEGETLNGSTVLTNDTDAEGDTLTAVIATNPSNGTLTLNSNGTFTYVHDGGESTSDSFTYFANDGKGNSTSAATVTLTITGINDLPVAVNDSYTINEGETLNGTTVLVNDTDAEGDKLEVSLDTDTTSGELALNKDGTFIYVHDGSESTSDFFTYFVNDGEANSETSARVTINIGGVNDAPVAVSDAFTLNEGETFEGSSVLANDIDADGDALKAVKVTGPKYGKLSNFNADGTFTYEHDGSETIEDSFTYYAFDGLVASNTVTVVLTISGVNDAPIAEPDTYSLNEGATLHAGSVLSNDTDPDGDQLTIEIDSDPSNGSLTMQTDGTFVYVHDGNESTTDSFTYHVFDGSLTSNIVEVTLNIIAMNDAPEAIADNYELNEGETLISTSVLQNDSDADGDQLTAVKVSEPSHGVLTFNSDGTFIYEHNGSESNADSFTYHAFDGELESNVVTVTITINGMNDVPEAVDDFYILNEGEKLSATSVLENDMDAEGNELTVFLESQPIYGQLTMQPDGTFEYIHDGSESTSDSFTYYAFDGTSKSNLATVTLSISAVNDVPVALVDSYSLNEGETLTASSILENDIDLDGDSLTAVMVTTVQHGELTLNSDGTFIYIHNGGESTFDSFTYYAFDGALASNIVTVTLNIAGVNDAPMAVADNYTLNEGETLLASTVLINDIDLDGDALTVVKVKGTEFGELSLNVDGTFTYIHNGDENTQDTFTYYVYDGALSSNTTTVTLMISSVNDAPIAVADNYTLNEGETYSATTVLVNDSDAENDLLTVELDSEPEYGQLTMHLDGSFEYIHDGSESTLDTFTYHLFDGELQSDTVTVTLNIESINDAPEAIADVYNLNEGETLNATSVLINDLDADGDTLSAVKATEPSNGVLASFNADGTFTYIHDGGESTQDSFTYYVFDGTVESASATVVLNISSINDAPQAYDQEVITYENTPVEITLSGFDADADELSFLISEETQNGQLQVNNESVVYTPNFNFFGEDSFLFKVNDGQVDSQQALVTIKINKVNDIPVALDDMAIVQENSTDNLINVLHNDSDGDGDTLTVISAQPLYGNVTIASDGMLVYTPLQDSILTDRITYTITDGDGGQATANVTVRIEALEVPVNLPPIAVDDLYEFEAASSVRLDVMQNDTDPEGERIALVSAYTQFGTVSIEESELVLSFEQAFSGSLIVNYSIADEVGNIATAIATVSLNNSEGPEITLPENLCGELTVNADALYTRVDLGEATAVDRFGNPLPVSLINDSLLFPPGLNEAYWQATDEQGNTTIEKQLVCVMPLISFEKNKTVLEGVESTIGVYLNGKSPVYPLLVTFDISGTADETDHSLTQQTLIIESGTEAVIPVMTYVDTVVEDNETLVLTLSDEINFGAKKEHVMTISEQNIEPEITLAVTQAGQNRMVVDSSSGNVTVFAKVYDPNLTDFHDYVWHSAEQALINVSTTPEAFMFDPANLAIGVYRLILTVNDSGSPEKSDTESVYIEVVEQLPVLTEQDTDGDLIPDNVEGLKDENGNGILDYLERIDECNVLQEEASVHDGYLMEGQAGVCLRKGDLTIGNESGASLITNEDISRSEEDELIPDPEAINIGGLFDYIAYGLPDQGQSIAIVLPQRKPIPAFAVYRKFRVDSGWGFFIEDEHNSLWSTQGEPGYCPPPNMNDGNTVWTKGLTEGHWCVQQIILDGGVNDDDGIVNGSVVDPGGVSVMKSANNLPVANDDHAEVQFNGSLVIDALENDTDEDNDVLYITSASTRMGKVEVIDNQLHFTAAHNYQGNMTIDYGITDNNGGTDHAVVYISTAVNKAPEVTNEETQIKQGESVKLNLLQNDSDPENDNLRLLSVDNPNVSFNDDGTVTFTPESGFSGEVIINYVVIDAMGNKTQGQWKLLVLKEQETVAGETKGGGSLALLLALLLLTAWYRLFVCKVLKRKRQDV